MEPRVLQRIPASVHEEPQVNERSDMKPTNPNHMHIGGDGKHPFQKSFSNSRPMAKTFGVKSKPGGEGKLISANASMRTKPKGGMTGPGEA
jgi:hypothetical protein